MTRGHYSPSRDILRRTTIENRAVEQPKRYVDPGFALPPLAANSPCGEPVVIYYVNRAGQVLSEGLACKGAPTGRKPFEHWVVFVGESRRRRRLVLPGPFQANSEAILEGLRALYEDQLFVEGPEEFLSDLFSSRAANDNGEEA